MSFLHKIDNITILSTLLTLTNKYNNEADKASGNETHPGAAVIHGSKAVQVKHVWTLVQLDDDVLVRWTVTRRFGQTITANTAVLQTHDTASSVTANNSSGQHGTHRPPLKPMGALKLQDWTLQDWFRGVDIAELDNNGLDNDASCLLQVQQCWPLGNKSLYSYQVYYIGGVDIILTAIWNY